MPIDTEFLIDVSGLSRNELSGALFDVIVRFAETSEIDIDPQSWWLRAVCAEPQTPGPFRP
ncbi:hypothetical protein ACIP98_36500 [Streptomyces sp. NPDC088354]|uniref:hypothetical protein n=1 Tax=Streptomyces sp. NPDC088354 TaxID=3365856 RepID=UPI0037FAC455